MTTTDPLHDALDRLSRLADDHHVPDRQAGILTKRRAQRARQAAVTSALAVVVVAGGVVLGQDLRTAGGDTSPPAGPPSAVARTPLSVAVAASDVGGNRVRASWKVRGTAGAEYVGGTRIEEWAARVETVLVDGRRTTASTYPGLECGEPGDVEDVDLAGDGNVTFGADAGTHEVTVVLEHCGTDGRRQISRGSVQVDVAPPAGTVDSRYVDLDGDGEAELVTLGSYGNGSVVSTADGIDHAQLVLPGRPVRLATTRRLGTSEREGVVVETADGGRTTSRLVALQGRALRTIRPQQ